MEEKKPDLTSLMEYSKKLRDEQSSQIPFEETLTPTATETLTHEPVALTESNLPIERPPAQDTLQALREYADQVPIGNPTVQASFPFHLTIQGKLTSGEKEKLLDLLEKHKMGIDRKDIEPQLLGEKILIPRISEYAGVLLVQALRGTQALIYLTPSECDEDESPRLFTQEKSTPSLNYSLDEGEHPAESLPVTQNSTLQGFTPYEFVDQVIVSATLKTNMVEAIKSAEYQEVLEALKREMKYRAHRKGAQALLDFEISLTPLSSPSLYKLTLMGLAVRAAKKKKKS